MPSLNLYGGQTAEALRTGGVNAQIPIINRATDAARSALSGSTQQTRQNLARSGFGNTAFGQSLLAEQGQQGAEDVAKIPTDVASSYISGAPAFASGLANTAMGGYGTAGGLNRSMTGSTTSTPSFWDFMMQGLLAGSSAAGAFAGS